MTQFLNGPLERFAIRQQVALVAVQCILSTFAHIFVGQRVIIRRGPRGPYKKRASKERSASSSRPRGGAAATAGSEPRRRPGRPRGSRNSSKEERFALAKQERERHTRKKQKTSPKMVPQQPNVAHMSPPAHALPAVPAHGALEMFPGGLPVEVMRQLPPEVLQSIPPEELMALMARDKEQAEAARIMASHQAALAAYAGAAAQDGAAAAGAASMDTYGRPRDHMAAATPSHSSTSSSSSRRRGGNDAELSPSHVAREHIPYSQREYSRFLRERGRKGFKVEEPSAAVNPIAPPPTDSSSYAHSPSHSPTQHPSPLHLAHMPSHAHPHAHSFPPEISPEFQQAFVQSYLMQQMQQMAVYGQHAAAAAGIPAVAGATIDLTDDSPPTSPADNARRSGGGSGGLESRKRKRGNTENSSSAKQTKVDAYQGGPKRVHHGSSQSVSASPEFHAATYDEKVHRSTPMLVSFAG